MKPFLKLIIAFFVMCAIPVACEKDEQPSDLYLVNSTVYDLMKDVYLWYTTVPDVDVNEFSTPHELMMTLRYDIYDRWSDVITKTEYNNFDQGAMIGYGFMFGEDGESNVRIASVYRNTQFDILGVKRGWIISAVNGTDVTFENLGSLLGEREVGVTNNFSFINENDEVVNLTIAKEEISVTPVLHHEIITQGSKKIGYMVFQTFIRSAYDEFEDVFTEFSTAGIDELVVDLRYNGGGYVTVADTLAGWLISDNYNNQAFVNFVFNARYSIENSTDNIPDMPASLNLSRIFFISTENTASASELVINGMYPYIPTYIAGSTTHGKPVGMSVLEFINYDYVVLPVTFKYTNADGDGDFFSGLPPDLPAEDDLTRDFGDPEEASLKAVLDYIETGIIPAKSASCQQVIKVRSETPTFPYLIVQ